MKLLQLIEAKTDEPSDTNTHMTNYRILAYRSKKAERKLSGMAGKKIIKPINRHPQYGDGPDWHEIEHLNMGIPNKPENADHIRKAKRYEQMLHKHHEFIAGQPLPNDLTEGDLEEIIDDFSDVLYGYVQEAEEAVKNKKYDSHGYPLLLTTSEVKDPENELEDERENYVQIFWSEDIQLFTRKTNIGKDKTVDRLVMLGQKYKAFNRTHDEAEAKLEWLHKGLAGHEDD